MGLITQEEAAEMERRCGEIDFLMGRLKAALERKITKEETLSPYQKWLGREMDKRYEKEKEFDKEIAEWGKGEKGEKGEKQEREQGEGQGQGQEQEQGQGQEGKG